MKPGEYLQREVRLIVVHCSASRCNASLYPESPEGEQSGTNSRTSGFHFFIRRDGEVCPVRPIGKPGAHTPGFDLHSIGICYEGGRDAAGGPADTRTVWQKKSLDDLFYALQVSFPESVVRGHDRLTARLLPGCPGFDAEKEYGR